MQCRSGTILNERAVYDLRSFGDLLNVIAQALQRLPHLLRVGSAIVGACDRDNANQIATQPRLQRVPD